MKIYDINIFLIIIYSLIFILIKIKSNYNKSHQLLKLITFLIFIQLLLIMSLRGIKVGADTDDYFNSFTEINQLTFKECIFLPNNLLPFGQERGFIILSNLIGKISDSYNFYLGIISIIILIPIFKIINKYSAMPLLSIILFITLNFFHFNMTGLRQGIAMSIVFLSFDYLIKEKTLKFILIILIAATIHTSAFVFIIVLLFKDNIFNTKKIILYFISLIGIYIYRKKLFLIGSFFYYNEESRLVETGAYTLFLIVVITFLGALFCYTKTVKNNKTNTYLYNIAAFAPLFMVFNTVSDTALRISNYFYLFMILLLPNVIFARKNQKEKVILVYILSVFTIIYYLFIGKKYLGTGDYYFYWQ